MRGSIEGKITIHMDCSKVFELSKTKDLKVSQLVVDGGSIIRKVIGPENKSKIEFECAHVKTKNVEDNIIINKGSIIALE